MILIFEQPLENVQLQNISIYSLELCLVLLLIKIFLHEEHYLRYDRTKFDYHQSFLGNAFSYKANIYHLVAVFFFHLVI